MFNAEIVWNSYLLDLLKKEQFVNVHIVIKNFGRSKKYLDYLFDLHNY
jgi:hypothetical protein